jgi:hypothetical protein
MIPSKPAPAPKAPAKPVEMTVFITAESAGCDECFAQLRAGSWIHIAADDKRASCLACAELDDLVFLPAGDAALSRRSRKYSPRNAVVVKWSRARKRYERQGILVSEEALAKAEAECLSDQDAREQRRQREGKRREELDQEYVRRFAEEVRRLFPATPAGREVTIAEHACQKYSGRVGRAAGAKEFNPEIIRVAVAAHIRHRETRYDELLARGVGKHEARRMVGDAIQTVLAKWDRGSQ